MKSIYSMACFMILILSLIHISCTKPGDDRNTTVSWPPPPLTPPPSPASSNQNMWVDANMDITIELPMNFAILNGGTSGPGRTVAKVKWEKISGPASYFLEYPNSEKTKVTNLEKGVYEFKLSATNNTGQTSDTMTLIVQDATSANKQIFFQKLNWSCPMGCSIDLGDALSYLPSNSPFTLYIRREVASDWELVVPESGSWTSRFVYSIRADHITVFDTSYHLEPPAHPDIKIVF